jgi:hypothetical protein
VVLLLESSLRKRWWRRLQIKSPMLIQMSDPVGWTHVSSSFWSIPYLSFILPLFFAYALCCPNCSWACYQLNFISSFRCGCACYQLSSISSFWCGGFQLSMNLFTCYYTSVVVFYPTTLSPLHLIALVVSDPISSLIWLINEYM